MSCSEIAKERLAILLYCSVATESLVSVKFSLLPNLMGKSVIITILVRCNSLKIPLPYLSGEEKLHRAGYKKWSGNLSPREGEYCTSSPVGLDRGLVVRVPQ